MTAVSWYIYRGHFGKLPRSFTRVAERETNMAYRSADNQAWSGMPFVIGQIINLSNNHTCKGVKGVFYDICDELAGEHPKEFKFVGWHPHCRCFVTAKLADYDEMNRWSAMSEEEKANYVFKGTVKDVPEGYKKWMADNAKRIAKAKSMPYFIKDNIKYAEEATGMKLE